MRITKEDERFTFSKEEPEIVDIFKVKVRRVEIEYLAGNFVKSKRGPAAQYADLKVQKTIIDDRFMGDMLYYSIWSDFSKVNGYKNFLKCIAENVHLHLNEDEGQTISCGNILKHRILEEKEIELAVYRVKEIAHWKSFLGFNKSKTFDVEFKAKLTAIDEWIEHKKDRPDAWEFGWEIVDYIDETLEKRDRLEKQKAINNPKD